MSTTRAYDLVLWGATGYTGRLVADYLVTTPRAKGLRWAIAGRDRGKLERVRGELGTPELPILLGDAKDAASLAAIAKQARVVCTTVGPYAQHGSGLVAACAAAGTHYCDLTGETHWIRDMIDAHHDEARASGARIVHTCGFDSIPSDLGVLMMHHEITARGGRLARVDAYFGESKGKLSGGTFASMLGIIDAARKDKKVRRVLGDPYGLNPPGARGFDGPDQKGVAWEPRLKKWTAPFVMAAINTRVVRRSNALLDHAYGEAFRYTEQMSFPGNARGLAIATGVAAAVAGVVVASQVPPLRKRLEARMPKPGEGPTEHERNTGYFVVRLLAEGEGGMPRLMGHVEDRFDPGYGSTARMLSEAALCLAQDKLTSPGGVLTPASAMGMTLIERLRAIGQTWTVEAM
jgi:short subunit dehydrogenase-like uncharacterized protein